MLYLPTLRAGLCGFRLPLAEATAATLISAATSQELNRTTASLLGGLRRDPALALWSTSYAWLSANQAIEQLHDLAAWLAQQELGSLLDPSREPQLAATGEAEIRTAAAANWPSFRHLGCRGVAIANQIEARLQAAKPQSDPQRDPQLLRGLLVDAAAWLAVAANPPTPVANQRISDWLPPELAESIRQFTPIADPPLGNLTRHHSDAAWGQEPDFDASEHATSARHLIEPVLSQSRRLSQLTSEFQDQLEQAKLHAMKELAYGASHEINNPLANISTRAQTLLREEYDPERRRALANINRQAFRAHEMIADMMLFANPPRIERRATNLGRIVQEVLDELRTLADERGVRMETSQQEAGTAWVDPIQIAVAIKALCQNAIEAMPQSGTLQIGAAPAHDRPSMTVITFRDSGRGLSDDVRKHLFEPFFSGREAGRGLGFGLSKVWRIVTDHEGQIEVDSQFGHGTTVTVRLPVAERAPASANK